MRKPFEIRTQRRQRRDETVAGEQKRRRKQNCSDGVELGSHPGSERVPGDHETGDEKNEETQEHELQPFLDENAYRLAESVEQSGLKRETGAARDRAEREEER